MLKAYGLGRLATKPTLREVPTQEGTTKVANFRMCSDQAYKKRGATEFSHKLTFIDVTCWGPLAERVATKLDKGHMVLVEGEIEQRQYISKKHGDAKITVHEIKAETVRNLGAPKAKVAVE